MKSSSNRLFGSRLSFATIACVLTIILIYSHHSSGDNHSDPHLTPPAGFRPGSPRLNPSTELHQEAGSWDSAAPECLQATTPPAQPINDLSKIQSKYAFATLLTTTKDNNSSNVESSVSSRQDSAGSTNNENYFRAVRLLIYQLLYAPETRSRINIPFIVLVSPSVSSRQRQRLQRDGAVVIEAEPIPALWMQPNQAEWNEAIAKLQLWELDQFDRIAFMDADTVLMKPLDKIFEDPAVELQRTIPASDPSPQRQGDNEDTFQTQLPPYYGFAGTPELRVAHNFPPAEGDWPNENYLNAGFFVVRPDQVMLDYYRAILARPGSFDSSFAEQNLLNHAHRREEGGRVPWKALDSRWNVHYANENDIEGGAMSVHVKWWEETGEARFVATTYLREWYWKMEGFFQARDMFLCSERYKLS